MATQCKVETCVSPSKSRGFCGKHYQRHRRYGDPLAIKRAERFGTPEESFAAKTYRQGACLVWSGGKNRAGYGAITVNGVGVLVHRWAYERAVGPIPSGFTIDHMCHNTSCVEPSHLRLADRYENAQNLQGARSDSRTGVRGLSPLSNGSWRARVQCRNVTLQKFFPSDRKADAIRWLIATRRELFGKFSDPTGDQAVGNIKKENQRGSSRPQ